MSSELPRSSVKKLLLDTNILLRLADPKHDLWIVANNAVTRLSSEGCEIFIVPQNLYEFWTVATKSPAANGMGETTEFAQETIKSFRQLFSLLPDDEELADEWLEFVVKHRLKGTNSYDARLVAAMKCLGIEAILTFNGSGFSTIQ